MTVDVVTTAMRRPEVLRATYASFNLRLRGVQFRECRLFINVDPLPAEIPAAAVLDVAREFFGEVVARTPDRADFGAAVRWCWSQPRTPYFLSLEDDWELAELVAIEELTRQLDADPRLGAVNLRAYAGFAPDYPLCLSPALIRTPVGHQLAARLVDGANPEQQLRPVRPDNPHGGKLGDVRAVQWPAHPIVRDIGRAWLKRSGYRKERERTFNQWAPRS